mgnify:CR=1 FL=1|jgi:hypothetical protein
MPFESNTVKRPDSVIGPTGERITLEDLPAPTTKRWVIRRKAEVVAAVEGGLLSNTDACARYNLSEEELETWTKLVSSHGLAGLRTTRVQQYRSG